jgi:hypothetical protein
MAVMRRDDKSKKPKPPKKGEPPKKAQECPCQNFEFSFEDWKDPDITSKGKRVQLMVPNNGFEFQIQTRLWAVLTCSSQANRVCHGTIECKVANAVFTDKANARIMPVAPAVVLPPTQVLEADCDGKATRKQTGFTITWFFQAPKQTNLAPRPPGVDGDGLILNGDIDLEFKLTQCATVPANPWRMKLKIKECQLDVGESNYDGDNKKNSAEAGANPDEKRKNMFDPAN